MGYNYCTKFFNFLWGLEPPKAMRVRHEYLRLVFGRYRTPRSQWKTMRVFSAEHPVTSVTLYQLRSNRSYELMVLARNRIGDALFSDTVSVHTKGQSQSVMSKTSPLL